ncbi:uncharacterized protein [Oscarella lobularis]|uniref:uncharacterized protein n=1 Tax=Oscarella lobularis TaxID=121494 RepID=UPI003313E05B
MEASVVTAGLHAAETAMKDTLAKAESDLKALGPESFVESKLTSLGRLISIYHACFVELGVKSRDEMNGICSKSKNEAVTEAYDDLLNTEVDWNQFLVRVDDLVSKDIDESNADFHSTLVTDARTGQQRILNSFFETTYTILVLLRHFA